MKAEIICIGTELLLGETIDTNAAYLAQTLAGLGIDLFYKTTVGDNLERLTEVLQRAWNRSDLILLSGGLGPTQDDLTREGIARLLGEDVAFHEEAWHQVQEAFARMKRPMPENNRRQAMLPLSAEPLYNRWGTAPGVWVCREEKVLAALPGVPSEMHGLMDDEVIPRLQRILGNGRTILVKRVLKVVGIGESALEERISDIIDAQRDVTVAPYAKRGEVHLRLAVKADSITEGMEKIVPVEQGIRERLQKFIFGTDDETLEGTVGRLLAEKRLTLATAESCTGGLIGHRITETPGSSDYYMVGLITYSNTAKMRLLGVTEETLERYGAVSAETADAMARGARERYGVDLALATTGIAGPGGGTATKPVGLVFMALASAEGVHVQKANFPWDRTQNKLATAQAALTMLWQHLTR